MTGPSKLGLASSLREHREEALGSDLAGRLDAVGDPRADALVAELMEMYGEGLARVFAVLDDAQRARLAEDPEVASLMLLHGLYPVDLETRVREALETVRPYMESHGGGVELVSLDGDVARLRLLGGCEGCPASASTLEHAIMQALDEHAPDLAGVELDGVEAAPVAPVARRDWREIPGDVPVGAVARVDDLLLANVDGSLLAYRNACASCGAPLDDAVLILGTLTCAACGNGFDLPRAGRSTDGAGLQLEPVPLLRENGHVRVAAAAAAAPEHDETACELCGRDLPEEHKHLLHLSERRILCVCGTCWSVRSGDAEFRPAGNRTLRLDDVVITDEQWASFQIPISLAFFMHSTVADGVVALYPSPAGATESELDLAAWEQVCAANPVLAGLEPDTEALIVNRMAEPPQHVIAPIDVAYRLVGVVKSTWEGISGGPAMRDAVAEYFEGLR